MSVRRQWISAALAAFNCYLIYWVAVFLVLPTAAEMDYLMLPEWWPQSNLMRAVDSPFIFVPVLLSALVGLIVAGRISSRKALRLALAAPGAILLIEVTGLLIAVLVFMLRWS